MEFCVCVFVCNEIDGTETERDTYTAQIRMNRIEHDSHFLLWPKMQ